MARVQSPPTCRASRRSRRSDPLYKGIVMDAWVKVSLVGIELITIEARVVVASVKYCEAVGRTVPLRRLRKRRLRLPERALQRSLPVAASDMEDETMAKAAESLARAAGGVAGDRRQRRRTGD